MGEEVEGLRRSLVGVGVVEVEVVVEDRAWSVLPILRLGMKTSKLKNTGGIIPNE